MKNAGRFRITQLILTAVLLLSMCFVWFSGARGANDISGFSAFCSPVALGAGIMLIAGIFMSNKGLCVFGSAFLVIHEIIMYLFWYELFGQREVFSIANSIKYAQPCFYIGFAVTVLVLAINIFAGTGKNNAKEESYEI